MRDISIDPHGPEDGSGIPRWTAGDRHASHETPRLRPLRVGGRKGEQEHRRPVCGETFSYLNNYCDGACPSGRILSSAASLSSSWAKPGVARARWVILDRW